MKIIDIVGLFEDFDLDFSDNEIDYLGHIYYGDLVNDIETEYLQKFTQVFCEKIEVEKIKKDLIILKISDLIHANLELFKNFATKRWSEDYAQLADDSSGEFEYQIIKEFDAVLNGYYNENANKIYYELLTQCK